MQKSGLIFSILFSAATIFSASGQRVDVKALKDFGPSTIKEVYEVCRYADLDAQQQKKLANQIEKLNTRYVKSLKAGEGYINVKAQRQLAKETDKMLASTLTPEQLADYYRGIYDAEAKAKANALTDRLQAKYSLTDENCKFVRVHHYKLFLESAALKRIYADQPKKANAEIARIKKEQMRCIEEKGGFRVNPDETITFLRPFDPNALHK